MDVHPDGKAYNITDGIIRARYRNGSSPELLKPETPYEFLIDLWSVGHVFLHGHRVRLDITSYNFPRWNRNLNISDDIGGYGKTNSARQHIFHDTQHQSCIILPVLPWE